MSQDEPRTPEQIIQGSTYGPRMRGALLAFVAGKTTGQAAREAGYADTRDLRRAIKDLRLREIHERAVAPPKKTSALIDRVRRVADLSLNELEKRLVETPEKFTHRDLGVVTGIALDKIAKKERWGSEAEGAKGTLNALDKIAIALKGKTIRLEISDHAEEVSGDESAVVIESEPIRSVPAAASSYGPYRKR